MCQIPAHWHATPCVRITKVPLESTEEEVTAALATLGDVKSAVEEGNGIWYARVAPLQGETVEQLRAKVSQRGTSSPAWQCPSSLTSHSPSRRWSSCVPR